MCLASTAVFFIFLRDSETVTFFGGGSEVVICLTVEGSPSQGSFTGAGMVIRDVYISANDLAKINNSVLQ